ENAYPEQWDAAGLREELKRVLGLDLPVDEWAKEEGIADEEIFARVERRADEHMAAKVAQWGPDVIRYVEKSILLQTLDHLWREHLVMLEHLRQVIGLRGYGQRDPSNPSRWGKGGRNEPCPCGSGKKYKHCHGRYA